MTRLEAENERLMIATLHEREHWARGLTLAGMDEAGRGPLAGPVVAACAVMPETPLIQYVKDSKQLSEKKREELFEKITQTAVAYGVGIVGPKEIDEVNILVATRRAFMAAYANMAYTPSIVLTDAMEGLDLPVPVRSFIRGDQISYSISAASIIAKVTRDRLMREMDEQYPNYGFARHKGYGTEAHYAAIREFGPCDEHRLTFLKSMDAKKETNRNRERGARGEELACECLGAKGFDIAERNFRTRGGEVDVIATRGDLLVFVEVKARENNAFGTGRDAVTELKQAKIIQAARLYASRLDAMEKRMRFDVIEVDLAYESVVHFEGAFEA